MKGEYVDRAPFTPDGERNLDRYIPAGFPQRGHHQLDQARVGLVEQSIELLAVPPETQVNRCPECRGRTLELTELDVLDPATIDPGDL